VYDPRVNQQLRATLRQKSARSQKQSETNLEGSLKSMVQTKSIHQHLQTTEKRMEIYPLKRDSKAQTKDQRSIVTTCKNTNKGFALSTY
jgi:hypothetical protein